MMRHDTASSIICKTMHSNIKKSSLKPLMMVQLYTKIDPIAVPCRPLFHFTVTEMIISAMLTAGQLGASRKGRLRCYGYPSHRLHGDRQLLLRCRVRHFVCTPRAHACCYNCCCCYFFALKLDVGAKLSFPRTCNQPTSGALTAL